MTNQKGYVDGDFLVSVGILLLAMFPIVLIVFFGVTGFGTPNSGSHTGYITAVEKAGLFQQNVVYFKTDVQSSQEDVYCAVDEIIEQLKQAQIKKKMITINYKKGLFLPMWECSSGETKIISIK